MKRFWLCFGMAVLCSSAAFAGKSIGGLYTNVSSGVTVTLSSDVSVTNTGDYNAAGILFDGSEGGAVVGSGNLSVCNTGASDNSGLRLYGIYANSVDVANYTGNITVNNDQSGHASSATSGDDSVRAYAYGIYGDVTGDVSGSITAEAIGGMASSLESSSYAKSYASAYGIYGDLTGDVTGSITAKVIGGTASAVSSASASSSAYGIRGHAVQVSNFTGNVSAAAVAGLEIVNGTTNASDATAYGIYASGDIEESIGSGLYLNATTGSISAVVSAPDGYDLTSGSAAYAIYGSAADDTVLLGDMDIVGDIELNGGTNTLAISGNTSIDGDLCATSGWLDFTVSGVLTPIGTVTVSDLLDDTFRVSSSGGFAFELYEDATSALNSKLSVNGGMAVSDGASISAYAAAGQTAADIVGNRYEVITTTDEITGSAFVESQVSMFDLAIEQSTSNVVITATGVKTQDGASTPSAGSVAQATVQGTQLVMSEISSHIGSMRSQFRGVQRPQVGGGVAEPEGPGGPSVADGEWTSFIRQFNDIGAQDSEGEVAGFEWQTSGFVLGAERLLNPNLLVGAVAGSAWTDLDGKDGAGGGSSELLMANLYANWFADRWSVEAGLNYAHADNTAQRIATDLQTYSGDYDSSLYGMWLEAGYLVKGKKYSTEPYVRSSYVCGRHDGYTDEGGTNPLTVYDNGTDNWVIETGVRSRRDWELENGDRLGLELKAGWQCELLDSVVSANGSLLGVNQTLSSSDSDRNALALGINADWKMNDAVTVSVEYAPTFAGNWYNHSIDAVLKYNF